MNNLGENRPTEEVEEEEERQEDRRWLWLALLLLLLVFCCLLSSSQLAIFHGLNDTIEAQLIPTDQNRINADDPLDGLTELPLDPAKVSRQLTAEKSDGVSSEVIVAVTRQIPGTAVAQRPTPTATNTPRPTFTAPAVPDVSTPSPAEKTATAQATQPLSETPGPTITNTPRPTFTYTPTPSTTLFNTPTPSSTVPGTQTFTPTPIPPTPTSTQSIVPTPTFTPLPPPTNTPVPPPTNTPRPQSTSTNTPVPPTPTFTLTPTETPIPTETPTLTPTPTNVPNAGVIIVPDQGVNANPGQIVTYMHTVTNTGSTADTFTISAISSQGYATTILPPNSITLSPGTSADVTLTVAVPNNAVAGAIDLTTVTAASASASDSAVDTTIVNQIIGVVIQPDSRVSVLPGQQAVHTHVVTNTGNAVDTITFAASGSNSGFSAAISPNPLTLGPFAGQTINVTIDTPSAGSVLSDETLIIASSGNGPATDSVTDTTILSDPDITLNAAAGDQLVSLGWTQTAPPAPSISYELEYSIAGGPWSTLVPPLPSTDDRYYHTGVINNTEYAYQLKVYDSGSLIGYSNVATATPGDISAHRTTRDCDSSTPDDVIINGTTFIAANCIAVLDDIDALNQMTDAGMALIFANGEVTLNYGTAPIAGIIDGPGYDFAYYGLPAVTGTITGTIMSFTLIDVSVDGSTWTTVFSWDGIPGGVDNSNVAAFGADGDGEAEAEAVPAAALLEDRMPNGPPPNWNTGVAIDIRPYLKAGVNYRYVRIRSPSGAAGARHLDAVYRIN